MASRLSDELRTLPTAEAVARLLAHLQALVAELAAAPVAAVTPDTAFAELKAVWQDKTVLAEVLLPRLYKELGLWLMPEELTSRPNELAHYIISELQPPAPATGYEDPYAGGTWAFRPPAPYKHMAAAHERGTAAFVLGPPRSGTTLLRTMLTGHPSLFSPPEISLLPFDTLADMRQELAAAGIDGFLAALPQAFKHLAGGSQEEAEAEVGALEAHQAPMAAVYKRLQDRAGGRLVVDKSPLYQAHLGWLQRAEQMFAAPRYLFLIRHPFPVLESMVRNRFNRWLNNWFGFWDDNPWRFAEKLWAIYTHNALEFLATIPAERQHWLRYEDLVISPETELRKVCRFLELEFDAAVTNPYLGERMIDGVGDPGLAQRSRVEPELARQGPRPPQPLNWLTLRVAERLGYKVRSS